MRNTFLLAGVALYGIACASSAPAPQVTPATPAVAAPRPVDAEAFRKELEADHNTAVAILMASVILGLAIIIAAALHG